jgi:hypothetical protein
VAILSWCWRLKEPAFEAAAALLTGIFCEYPPGPTRLPPPVPGGSWKQAGSLREEKPLPGLLLPLLLLSAPSEDVHLCTRDEVSVLAGLRRLEAEPPLCASLPIPYTALISLVRVLEEAFRRERGLLVAEAGPDGVARLLGRNCEK